MSFLQLDSVGKEYCLGNTRLAALSEIDLDIERGEFCAIWGPSGSGKSTLLNILATIDMPTWGRYWFDDQEVSQLNDRALTALRQCRVGIIFQNFNLVPVLTALENVMLPLQVAPNKPRDLRQRAMDLLAEVGVADHVHRRPDHLSGGQRQRVAIARALIAEPDFVVADEPTANLDSRTSEIIIRLLADMNDKHGTTFVFATHHDVLIEAARRTIHLHDGRVVEPGEQKPSILQPAVAETRLC